MQLFIRLTLLLVLLFSNTGCETSQDVDLKRGLKYQLNGDYREALVEFDKAMKRDPASPSSIRAARESAKILIYDLKNFDRAISVLRFLILYSNDPQERWKSQNQIAQIYFDNLAWYDKALSEYSKLLSSDLSKVDQIKIRLSIARSYYHLGQFGQSWSEAAELLRRFEISKDQEFDLLLLEANIHLALKKYAEASKAFELVLSKFPEHSKKENVGLNLALCYEELGVVKDALRVLETLRATYEPKEYIELRIKKLRGRVFNSPVKRIKK